MTVVWSYGGGVQSAGIAALIVTGKLQRPDLIVIADTGREVESTWNYMREVVEPALGQKIHVAPHSLATVDLYGTNGDLLIPATTRRGEWKGRLPTFCSNEWKQRPVRRWLREQGVTRCDLWLGISRDEVDRMKPSGIDWMTHCYPLIDLGLRRSDCIAAVRSLGWPSASKSRCFMCPHQNTREWKSLPAPEFEKAVLLEQSIREKDSEAYLHHSGKSLAEAMQSDDQLDLFDGCDSGYCYT